MKKLNKKLVLKALSIVTLAPARGGEDAFTNGACISAFETGCCPAEPTPSDANGNCRTYTPTRFNC